jgi:hypothetical protein
VFAKQIPLLGALGALAIMVLGIYLFVIDQQRKEIKQALARMDRLEADWTSDMQIASATSRIALAGPVLKLREREEELMNLKVPECLGKGKTAMLSHMRKSIQAFTSFMAQEEFTSTSHMAEAAKKAADYKEGKKDCEKLIE